MPQFCFSILRWDEVTPYPPDVLYPSSYHPVLQFSNADIFCRAQISQISFSSQRQNFLLFLFRCHISSLELWSSQIMVPQFSSLEPVVFSSQNVFFAGFVDGPGILEFSGRALLDPKLCRPFCIISFFLWCVFGSRAPTFASFLNLS